jgi:hypothetical protein
MKIWVGFSKSNALPSRFIRWWTNGQESHTYIRFYDSFLDAWLVLHADWPGVVMDHWPKYQQSNTIVEEYEIDDPRNIDLIKATMPDLRMGYDYWNILGWAWVITFKRWLKKKIENPIDDPKKLICSDFVALRFLRYLSDLPRHAYNPTSLRKWMIENYHRYSWIKDTK